MAWEDWKDKILGGCQPCQLGASGRYYIPEAGAFLAYRHVLHKDKTRINIIGIHTDPDKRGNGVGEALIRRLREDHPTLRLYSDTRTKSGAALGDKFREIDPLFGKPPEDRE